MSLLFTLQLTSVGVDPHIEETRFKLLNFENIHKRYTHIHLTSHYQNQKYNMFTKEIGEGKVKMH